MEFIWSTNRSPLILQEFSGSGVIQELVGKYWNALRLPRNRSYNFLQIEGLGDQRWRSPQLNMAGIQRLTAH